MVNTVNLNQYRIYNSDPGANSVQKPNEGDDKVEDVDLDVQHVDRTQSGYNVQTCNSEMDAVKSSDESEVVHDNLHPEEDNLQQIGCNAVDRNLDQEMQDMERALNNAEIFCTSKIVEYPSTSEGEKE